MDVAGDAGPALPAETRKQACKDKLVIKRVPFSLNRAVSGVSVKVQLPNGTELAEPNVTVEDVFVVAMGDSFASGRKQSRPTRDVQCVPARWSTTPSISSATASATRSHQACRN